jgi:hypothetical protein
MVRKASQKACTQMATVKEKDTKPMVIDTMLIVGKGGIVSVERETRVRQCVTCRLWWGVAERIQRESKQRPEEEKIILAILAGIFFGFVGKTRDLVVDQGLLRNDVWLWLKLKETASDIPHPACHKSVQASKVSDLEYLL